MGGALQSANSPLASTRRCRCGCAAPQQGHTLHTLHTLHALHALNGARTGWVGGGAARRQWRCAPLCQSEAPHTEAHDAHDAHRGTQWHTMHAYAHSARIRTLCTPTHTVHA